MVYGPHPQSLSRFERGEHVTCAVPSPEAEDGGAKRRVRATRLLFACSVLLLLATGCVTGGDDDESSDNPTPGPQFAIVTLTPVPPGATVVIEPTATIDPTTLRRHTIKDGESLSSIASDYGVSQEELQTLNNIDDPNSIQVGQELLIPPS